MAKRTARDAPAILCAEIAAGEMLASALYRYNQASGELNWLNEQGRQQPQQPQQQQRPAGDGLSDAARQLDQRSSAVQLGCAVYPAAWRRRRTSRRSSRAWRRTVHPTSSTSRPPVAQFGQGRDAPQENP